MSRRAFKLLAAAIAAAIVVAVSGAWGARRLSGSGQHPDYASAEIQASREFEARQQEIAIFERRAAEDPISAADRAELAARYLQRSRETGDFNDVMRADSLARKSIALRTNLPAVVVLVASLIEQHRFAEARAYALELVAAEPGNDQYRAMLGEISLEVGDYDGARKAFDSFSPAAARTLAVAASYARWLEIIGDPQGSRRLLYRATAMADSARHLQRETVAWFRFRLADAEMRQGRLRGAERALRSARALLPKDHRFLAADARLASLRHDWRKTIALGDSAINTVMDPATVGLVGDAYAALGDTAKANEYHRTMEVAVIQQPGDYHRAWSLFLLDHDRRVPEVLASVERELQTRRDIYGYDLLGWALYKQRRYPEARRALEKAMSMGTKDAVLFYHAGMIEHAAGNREDARRLLSRALELNPVFDAAHPAVAKETLAALKR